MNIDKRVCVWYVSSKKTFNEEHIGSIPCGSKAEPCSSMKNTIENTHIFLISFNKFKQNSLQFTKHGLVYRHTKQIGGNDMYKKKIRSRSFEQIELNKEEVR